MKRVLAPWSCAWVLSGCAAQASAPDAATVSAERQWQERAVATLVRMRDAVNAGDASTYASAYAEDAVIRIQGGALLEGRSAIEQYEADLLREFPEAHLGFYDLWQKESLAAVHYAVSCRTAGGGSMGHEGLLFFRFRSSGEIEEERRYMDSLTPMAQLGALGAVAKRALPELSARMETHLAGSSPAERENVATVRSAIAALDAEDERAFLAACSDDVVLDELVLAWPYSGKPGVQSWLESWCAAIDDASSQVTTLFGAADCVLAELVLRGRMSGEFGPLPASVGEFVVHRAALFRLEDGRITRVASFMNGKELAQAVGAWPLAAK